MSMPNRSSRILAGAMKIPAALLLLLLVLLLFAVGGRREQPSAGLRDSGGVTESTQNSVPTSRPRTSEGLEISQLPTEARRTLELIRNGGPFLYGRDGITFANRERLLPVRDYGYYREYTVKTPGASDRGARRIIAGRNGEYFYTDDHYRSFKRIRE